MIFLSEIKFIHEGRILNFNFNWNNYGTNTVLNYGSRKLKEEKKKYMVKVNWTVAENYTIYGL